MHSSGSSECSTCSLESESSSEECLKRTFSSTSKMQIKLNIEKGKNSEYFYRQSSKILNENQENGEICMTMKETCHQGEITDGKCNIFKKAKNFLGFRKNFKGWACKKLQMCQDKNKGLKRISCQNSIGHSDGWQWCSKNQEDRQGVIKKIQKWGSHVKSKIKRKVVYKDEQGNIIDPDLIKNGEYVPKDDIKR
jgi:ribosomal protein S28E/S33